MAQRLHDWQLRFEACLAERWVKPMVWGSLDCCLFAADCVEAITGADPAAEFRGQYDSMLGAMRILNGAGGLSVLVANRLGAEIAPALAQAGDVGLSLDDAGQPALVVCGGGHWLGVGERGLVYAAPPSRVWRCC